MSNKERALDAIAELPIDCTYLDVIEKMQVIAAIEEGLDALDRGEVVSHDEVKAKISEWATS